MGALLLEFYGMLRNDCRAFNFGRVFLFFSRSTGTEEITIDPNSQWNPVPVKLDIKEEGGLWATLHHLQLT